MATVLVIEDEANLRYSIRSALERAGHDVAEAGTAHEALHLWKQRAFDAVVTDVNLGGDDGIQLVRQFRGDGFDGAIVVMTGFGSIENAVEAMKLGADDYLQKQSFSVDELVLVVARLLDHRRVRRHLTVYRRLEGSRRNSAVVGSSEAWRKALRLAERIAQVPVSAPQGGRRGDLPSILIVGETGSGKGVLARYIHDQGQRTQRRTDADQADDDAAPFVHVNCTSLPPSLVESELFGHEKGAFTDAKNARAGLFEMAEGGTIFLDEIGDMPLDLQAKILTVVEDGVFRRVGGSRDRRVFARVIAATNQDLEQRVEEGRFRRDLLYRLNALTIRIPPLRERGDDAVELASATLAHFAREYGRPDLRFTDAALETIRRHDWPGNAREVINMTQRLAMLCDEEEVEPEDLGLPTTLHWSADDATDSNGTGSLTFDFRHGIHRAAEVERELIIQALKHTGGNVSQAAKLVGMQRSSLRNRIERFGLQTFVQEIVGR